MTERQIIKHGNPVMCPKCNAINDKDDDRSCWNCGRGVPN